MECFFHLWAYLAVIYITLYQPLLEHLNHDNFLCPFLSPQPEPESVSVSVSLPPSLTVNTEMETLQCEH